jgi:hypothetical protein
MTVVPNHLKPIEQMTKYGCLLILILILLVLQSCAVHSTQHLYRSLKPEEITEVNLRFGDSSQANNKKELKLGKADAYFSTVEFQNALTQLFTNNKAAFSNNKPDSIRNLLKNYNQYVLLTFSREKDWCNILLYSASVKFISATKGDGIVTIGHMGSPVVYAGYRYLTTTEDINKLITFTNVLVRHYNETAGTADKQKIPVLSLVK